MNSDQQRDICSILASPDALALWCHAHFISIEHGRTLLRRALYKGVDVSEISSKQRLIGDVFKRQREKIEQEKEEEQDQVWRKALEDEDDLYEDPRENQASHGKYFRSKGKGIEKSKR